MLIILANVVDAHPKYYSTLKHSTDSINLFKDQIEASFEKLKMLYDDAAFNLVPKKMN